MEEEKATNTLDTDVENQEDTVNEDSKQDLPANKPSGATKKGKLLLSKKQIIITVLVATLLAGSGAAALVINHSKNSKPSNTPGGIVKTSESGITEGANEQNSADKAVEVKTVSGSTYFSSPKKLADLDFFNDFSYWGTAACDNNGNNCDTPAYSKNDLSYYQVGVTKDSKAIIVVYAKAKNIDGGIQYIALQTGTNTYQILAQNNVNLKDHITNKQYNNDDFKKILNKLVTLDENTELSELKFPTETTVAGQKIKVATGQQDAQFMPDGQTNIRGYYLGDLKSDQKVEKIGAFGDYTLHKVIAKTTANYRLIELYGTLGNLFTFAYYPNGELASTTENVPINWKSGDTTAFKAYSGGAGCGSTGYVSALNVNASDLTQIGTTKLGQKVYQLPQTAAITKELYEEDYAKGEFIENAALKNLTLQQFMDKHAYFIAENGLGEYVVFQRDDMFLRGGCGKPVVYLYPTTATTVNVKVGANVVLSSPHYEQNGWKNVFAQPNGKLTYRGTDYDSLYWEGYGDGVYPEVSEGVVVSKAEAPSTIRSQLAAQGFNNKEISDFMDYWQPKLPNKPFVRLTWFGTEAMNRLAPLTITPSPQTLIRTFLDFEGLDQPIYIKPQHFSIRARNGFTVTEWGGLLRDGIR